MYLSRPPAPRTGSATQVGLVVPYVSTYPRGGALVEREVGEGCRAVTTACKKPAAPAGLRTCVELRRGRE